MNRLNRCILILVLGFIGGAMVGAANAQSFASVKGACKDVDGKPLSGAIVQWLNTDNGRKYELKTNKNGEYFSLGIEPGTYNVRLLQDGKELFHEDKRRIGLEEVTVDFDLSLEQKKAAAGAGLTPEQLKERQAAQAKQEKEVGTVKTLNQKLAAANESLKTGDFDAAVTTLNEANTMDPTRDVIWGALAEAYMGSAMKQTDPAEKTKRLEQAIQDYEKAVELKKQAMASNPKPESNAQLAALYNNMARAKATVGKVDDAIADFNQAAQLNPPKAATYYFNLGAILTNSNKTNDAKLRQNAIDAFDKAVAADPNYADAYYYKGTSLVGGATLKGDKMVAPDGTAEAFNKYLELQPTGPHAEDAKAMLASMGAPIETSFGKKKAAKK